MAKVTREIAVAGAAQLMIASANKKRTTAAMEQNAGVVGQWFLGGSDGGIIERFGLAFAIDLGKRGRGSRGPLSAVPP